MESNLGFLLVSKAFHVKVNIFTVVVKGLVLLKVYVRDMKKWDA